MAKDVLEYVVLEKHLSSLYGKWRLHGKIIPEWLSASRTPSWLTQVVPDLADLAPLDKDDPATGHVKADNEQVDEADEGVVYDAYGKKIK